MATAHSDASDAIFRQRNPTKGGFVALCPVFLMLSLDVRCADYVFPDNRRQRPGGGD